MEVLSDLVTAVSSTLPSILCRFVRQTLHSVAFCDTVMPVEVELSIFNLPSVFALVCGRIRGRFIFQAVMKISPGVRIFFVPGTELDRLLQTLGAVICFQPLQAFVLCIFAHVLDNIGSDIIHLVNGVDFHEPSTPYLLKLLLLNERQIANHVVVNRPTFLKLNDSHIHELRIPVFQTPYEVMKVPITSLDVGYIEALTVIESQCHELATAIKVRANQLPNSVSSLTLTLAVILFVMLSFLVTFLFTISTAGGIESFVSPNFDNPLRCNDFLVVSLQPNHPLSQGANRSVFRHIRIV